MQATFYVTNMQVKRCRTLGNWKLIWGYFFSNNDLFSYRCLILDIVMSSYAELTAVGHLAAVELAEAVDYAHVQTCTVRARSFVMYRSRS